MTPRMSAAELGLLASFLRCAQHYYEFGAGGSTCLAASLVAQSVTAVDSSQAWLDEVMRRYVARLEALCREAPYNWFNFYDFWA